MHSGSSVTTLAREHAAGIITADKKSALSKHVLDTGALRIAACFLQFPLKHLCTSTRLHGVVYQKIFIFGATAMRTSNLTELENVSVCVLDKLHPEERSIDIVDTTRT